MTPFKRKIKVEKRKAFNYLIQSTTADLVLDRAVEVDKMLEGKKSFVSHIVHDELVIDVADGRQRNGPSDPGYVFPITKLISTWST